MYRSEKRLRPFRLYFDVFTKLRNGAEISVIIVIIIIIIIIIIITITIFRRKILLLPQSRDGISK